MTDTQFYILLFVIATCAVFIERRLAELIAEVQSIRADGVHQEPDFD